jgi:hypothetical protein
MRLPKSKAARTGLTLVLLFIAIPALAMAYFQTLDPPTGVASKEQLRAPPPSARPAGMGAGLQLSSIIQSGPSDGPGIAINPNPHRMGDPASGRNVFRFETFGNEGFWTDGLRWLRGIQEARVTPLKALAAGMLIDADLVEPALLAQLAAEARTDLSLSHAPLLHDPQTLLGLIE